MLKDDGREGVMLLSEAGMLQQRGLRIVYICLNPRTICVPPPKRLSSAR